MTEDETSLATQAKPSVPQAPLVAGMRLKIGVMGGAGEDISREYLDRSASLGQAIAEHGCVLVTGACPGLPLAAADSARRNGGFVVGISPALSLDEHIDKYASPGEGHDVIIYTGAGMMGREVINIRTSDIVVIVGGRAGTLGEFAIAYDEGKLIGVLQGTGGITSLIPAIVEACNKQTGAKVYYDDDPKRLVQTLLGEYRTSHYRHPSCFALPESAKGNRTVRDVVCGMWLDPSIAAETRIINNHRLVFCCRACAEAFDSDPQRFLK